MRDIALLDSLKIVCTLCSCFRVSTGLCDSTPGRASLCKWEMLKGLANLAGNLAACPDSLSLDILIGEISLPARKGVHDMLFYVSKTDAFIGVSTSLLFMTVSQWSCLKWPILSVEVTTFTLYIFLSELDAVEAFFFSFCFSSDTACYIRAICWGTDGIAIAAPGPVPFITFTDYPSTMRPCCFRLMFIDRSCDSPL